MKLRSNKGFSLVELIIVIAILGIIAVIAVPNLTNIQKNSQVNADIRTAESIGKAVRIWLTDAPNVNTINARENEIASGKKLSTIQQGLDQYVSLSYIPGAKSSTYYFVKLNNNVIEVSIAASAHTTGTNYGIVNGAVQEGLAYKEGTSGL